MPCNLSRRVISLAASKLDFRIWAAFDATWYDATWYVQGIHNMWPENAWVLLVSRSTRGLVLGGNALHNPIQFSLSMIPSSSHFTVHVFDL